MLSRLHRKAEALDAACLRAWGHPDDPAVRQELLSALEWDSSFRPDHARPAIRVLFAEMRDHSSGLAQRLQGAADNDGVAHTFIDGILVLRRSLAVLIQVLETRSQSRTPPV